MQDLFWASALHIILLVVLDLFTLTFTISKSIGTFIKQSCYWKFTVSFDKLSPPKLVKFIRVSLINSFTFSIEEQKIDSTQHTNWKTVISRISLSIRRALCFQYSPTSLKNKLDLNWIMPKLDLFFHVTRKIIIMSRVTITFLIHIIISLEIK